MPQNMQKRKKDGEAVGKPFNKAKRGFDKTRKTFKNRTNAKKRIQKKPIGVAVA